MIELDEKFVVIELLDHYSALLTPKQEKVTRLYFELDTSLSEISDELKVSRQAVYDMISKSVSQLKKIEKKLCLCQKLKSIEEDVSKLDLSTSQKEKVISIINRL